MSAYRHNASFGKREEFTAIADLIRRGYDTYVTLVDDQGIDCVIRQGPEKYFDIQIKARSKNCVPRNAGFFPLLHIKNPRKSYVFIFYSEMCELNGKAGVYWVIPSDKIAEPRFGNVLKSGKNKGKFRLHLTNHSRKTEKVTPRPKYIEYVGAFDRFLGKPLFDPAKEACPVT